MCGFSGIVFGCIVVLIGDVRSFFIFSAGVIFMPICRISIWFLVCPVFAEERGMRVLPLLVLVGEMS